MTGNDKLPTNSKLVQDLLLQLDTYKSMGLEGIHLKVIREMANVITRPLSIIFPQLWESGEIPFDGKLVNIVPVFKKG